MSIVSNASPLINPARIGRLALLEQLYSELLIPTAVWNEVVVEGHGKPGAEEISNASWLQTREVNNKTLVQALREDLDPGEAEAIALALETNAERLLMDEHRGRETARHLGLQYTGLIGVLIEAKHQGIVSSMAPLLEKLREMAGFRLSDALYKRIWADEGEA